MIFFIAALLFALIDLYQFLREDFINMRQATISSFIIQNFIIIDFFYHY